MKTRSSRWFLVLFLAAGFGVACAFDDEWWTALAAGCVSLVALVCLVRAQRREDIGVRGRCLRAIGEPRLRKVR